MPIFLLLGLLGISLVVSTNADTSSEFEHLVTMEKLDLMLQQYFSNLNTTEIYNNYEEYLTTEYITYEEYITNEYYNITYLNESYNNYINNNDYITYEEYITNEYYNITYLNETYNSYIYNEYYYYNQTFLSQTFNEFITNEYYEDNYYNTYNQYNQTFLNQTFIDNDYYNTYNQYNETLFEEMLSSINNIWNYINNRENEKINLQNVTNPILDLSGSNCNQIEFMFKDSNILSIYDVLGLGISTQLSQVNNINIEHSVFIDNLDNILENNIYNTNYDYISNNFHSIKSDYNDDFEINFNSSLTNNELLFNWASEKWDEAHTTNIMNIYEDNIKKLEIYAKDRKIYLKNSITGDVQYHNKITSKTNNQFTMYNLKIYSSYVELYDENEVLLMTLDINLNTDENTLITIKGENTDGHNIYLRSIYLNNGILEILNDKYVLDNEEQEYNRNNWNKAEIYILDDSVLYNINNNVVTQNYNLALNQTKDNYHLVINLNETSLSNLYCRD